MTTSGARTLRLTKASDITAAARGTRRPEWGPWDIDRDARVLWIAAPGRRYEIDLEDCTTSARVLDWICQVAGKQWQDRDRVIAGLITALDDVLNPQAPPVLVRAVQKPQHDSYPRARSEHRMIACPPTARTPRARADARQGRRAARS